MTKKIAAQTQKLERIKEIQQSYLTEMNTMKNLIDSFCGYLLERAEDPRMLREFNMTAAEAGEVVAAAEMDCYVDYSSDGKNHFVMMCRK